MRHASSRSRPLARKFLRSLDCQMAKVLDVLERDKLIVGNSFALLRNRRLLALVSLNPGPAQPEFVLAAAAPEERDREQKNNVGSNDRSNRLHVMDFVHCRGYRLTAAGYTQQPTATVGPCQQNCRTTFRGAAIGCNWPAAPDQSPIMDALQMRFISCSTDSFSGRPRAVATQ